MAATSGTGDLLELFSDLVRCETRLYNLLDDGLRREHGIVTSQYEFLRHIRDHPECRVADLALEFAVGVGATSKAVDRLEARGLVARHPNPSDRRSMVLSLTADGTTVVDGAERFVRLQLGGLLAGSESVLGSTGELLRTLRRALEHDHLGMPAG